MDLTVVARLHPPYIALVLWTYNYPQGHVQSEGASPHSHLTPDWSRQQLGCRRLSHLSRLSAIEVLLDLTEMCGVRLALQAAESRTKSILSCSLFRDDT